jgi:anti-anti-sigma regulatory factor
MVLVTANNASELLCLHYVGQVLPGELSAATAEIQTLLAGLKPGFRLLADLSQAESFDPDCAPEIGRTMELLDRSGVGLIVRAVPDPAKDIGLNILSVFHYPHRPRVITCQTLAQALKKLA